MITTLPDELLFEVISHLYIVDIFSLRLVCQFFNNLTRLRTVWVNAYRMSLNRFPLPLGPFPTQEVSEIESLLGRAERTAQNWDGETPTPRQVMLFPTNSDWDVASFFQDHFLLVGGPGGINCYDLQSKADTPIASWGEDLASFTHTSEGEDALIYAILNVPRALLRRL